MNDPSLSICLASASPQMRMVVIDMVSWFYKDRPMGSRPGKRADGQAEDPDGAIARAIAKTARMLLLEEGAMA